MVTRHPRKQGTPITAIVADVNSVSTAGPAAQVCKLLSASRVIVLWSPPLPKEADRASVIAYLRVVCRFFEQRDAGGGAMDKVLAADGAELPTAEESRNGNVAQ